ncbi:glucokinase [Paenibacillus endophyticus]|uniref:Glucokinase n=1 Tax=Paenibacillus endophyticus TaxID=1294268 RepID=A0A7W5G8D6_9BACL|nr:ROK family protein [Paenibacillus endophyticus]MBB3150506.1 glucokinase [Paenibacillus endophyticus]
MNSSIILAFDVGGTQIKAAALINGSIISPSVAQYDAHSDQGASEIIARFVAIASDVLLRAGSADKPIGGIGMAFPGPFEYENGISRIQGLAKYESLYGLPFGNLLEEAIREEASLKYRLDPDFRIRFENDAALFGLGEAGFGTALGAKRTVFLTVGTGLGSCFLENGQLVKERFDVPDNGWLYTIPYKSGIADDYASRRGVLELASELGMDGKGMDVHEFAALANEGDPASIQLFAAFGERMAVILEQPLHAYQPDLIVFGGQISKSGHLFVPAFQNKLAALGIFVRVAISQDTLESTFKGIYEFVK